jgi:hypothetical protein
MTAFVDASHAANKKTRRSHTGYVIFLNRAPIVWYSKRQQTVETSTFSSEFIALKACLEAVEHLRFKLRCFFFFALTFLHIASDCFVNFSLEELYVLFVQIEVLFHIPREGFNVVFFQVILKGNCEHPVFCMHVDHKMQDVVVVHLLSYV